MNSLPDPNDNHVVVAAVKRKIHYIVTENVKDFLMKNLRVAGTHPLLEAVSTDNVIEHIGTVGLSLEIQIWSKKRFQGILKFAEIVYQNQIKPNE